jgi:hypothetical protein
VPNDLTYTPKDVEKVFQKSTIDLLAAFYSTLLTVNPQGVTAPNPVIDFSYVRVGWQTTGQPAHVPQQDVVYLLATEVDDEYNKNRDVNFVYNVETLVDIITTYVRVWKIQVVCYGPNSFQNARVIKSGQFSQPVHDFLASQRLYLVTALPDIRRIPENYAGQWWERCDLNLHFNEMVTEYTDIGTALSTDILVFTDLRGEIADIPITKGKP